MINRFNWTEKSFHRNQLTQSYEPIQPYIFCELAKAIGVEAVFDIGANIGFYSVVLGSLESVTNVYSFEPIRDAFKELRENIELNGLRIKATLFNTALSDSQGNAIMDVFGELSGANSIASSSIHRAKKPLSSIKIKTNRLDELVALKGAVIAIKADVEGHEFEVLKGAKELFSENKGVLQIELYGTATRKTEIINWLSNMGWKKLIAVGPDAYFSNLIDPADCKFLLTTVETSMMQMLDRETIVRPDAPIRRNIGGGLSLVISGSAARLLRNLFKKA